VLIELKGPGIPLKAKHIGQVLEYKALIQKNKPNVKNIHCFVFGYEKDQSFMLSRDAEMKTFSELVAELRAEYREYKKIIDQASEVDEVVD
jgi:NAD(P)H-nitrite reductase large subunit